MKKDTRFSIRKLTVGVASIAVASFLTSGTVDAADLSILHSKNEKAAGYNPELPFEPFPPSISYTQPEAPWMQGSVDTELPGDDVEDVTEPRDPNYVNPEAPFAPATEANYENPEAPFAPAPVFTEAEAPFAGREVEVEEDPVFTEAEAPFAGREVEVEDEPEFTEAEAPFAGREVEVEDEPEFTEAEAPFAGREVEVEEDDVDDVTEPLPSNGVNPEAPFAPVEEDEDEEDLEFEILPGYKVEEAMGADGKIYKRLVPIEDETEEEVEEDTPETEEEAVFETREEAEAAAMKALENDPINGDFEVLQGADGKYYYVLKPAAVIPEDYATREEAEAAALEALADDEINNAYEIVKTADGRYAYLLSIKEEVGEAGEVADTAEELDTKIVYPAPSQEAKELVINSYGAVYDDLVAKGADVTAMNSLVDAGLAAYRQITGNNEATRIDALAAGLEYYRVVSKNESAKLEDVIAELDALVAKGMDVKKAYSLTGALELDAKYSDSKSPKENYIKAMGVEVPVYTDDELAQVKEMAENGNENAKKILDLLGL